MRTRLPRLLAFFPHPDDEVFAAGTLALAADAGVEVEILTATRGESGGDPAVRVRELRAACAAIGCGPPRFLDLPDAGLADVDDVEAAARLRDHLDTDVVLTLGADGVYGHPDHLACTRWMSLAVGDRPVRLLHTAFPPHRLARFRRRLRRFRPELVAWDGPLGVAEADVTVDIRRVRDRKVAAVAAHRSQLPGGDPRWFLEPGLLDDLLAEERFTCAAGPPPPLGATGIFDGL